MPWMVSWAEGEEEPMPTRPLPKTSRKAVPEEEATSNMTPLPWSVVSTCKTLVPLEFCTAKAAVVLTGGWMVTWPVEATLTSKAPVEVAISSKSEVEPEEPWIASLLAGVAVPIPTFPLANTVKKDWLDDEATVSIDKVGLVLEPSTTRLAVGVEELIPSS